MSAPPAVKTAQTVIHPRVRVEFALDRVGPVLAGTVEVAVARHAALVLQLGSNSITRTLLGDAWPSSDVKTRVVKGFSTTRARLLRSKGNEKVMKT